MIEGLLMLMGLLLALTIGAAIEYYKQVGKAQKEYEKARGIIEDIVFSFNRELKRNAENTETLIYKVEESATKAETSLKKAENIEKKLAVIENALNMVSEKYTGLLLKTTDVETKTNNVEAAY
ncbi:MAG: hypothetical protein QXD70_03515, partial [Candidatus Bathyarchaeia archaeon]